MRVARVAWIALTLSSACLRFGYEVPRKPADAGVVQPPDASGPDPVARSGGGGAGTLPASGAGAGRVGGSSVRAGRGGSVAATGGSSAAAAGGAGAAAVGGGGSGAAGDGGGSGGVPGAGMSGGSAGVYGDPTLGDTGLHLSDVLGYYSGDWGDMVLRPHGSVIWGVYQYSGGTIVGTIGTDGVFSGWWTQLPSRAGFDAGEVEFRWSQTGNVIALDGRWRYGSSGDWLENWDVSLVTDRAAPSTLTDRFAAEADFVPHP